MSCAAHALAASRLFLVADDVDFIQELVRALPGEKPFVVDIGAGSGTTALSILEARDDVRVLTIDHNQENIGWAAKAVMQASAAFLHRWEGIVKDSVEAVNVLPVVIVPAMILLDTSHVGEATTRELEAWWPKLPNHGIFWMHDYTAEYPDHMVAIDRFLRDHAYHDLGDQGLGKAVRKENE